MKIYAQQELHKDNLLLDFFMGSITTLVAFLAAFPIVV